MRVIFLRLFLVLGSFAFALPSESPTSPEFSDLEYQIRLSSISCVFDFKFTPAVKELILRQVSERGKKTTEHILGMSEACFPVIDQALAQKGLPEHLRYVPWIESHFNPSAVSPKGAAGAWQFMPGTANLYGLKINRYVDERLDLRKSSAAAARLFARLYLDYQDWALALAAYNCGSVRVNNAMKAANSKDYWEISKLLPNETQLYVPRFIAAVYMGAFYQHHQLQPTKLPEEYSATDTIMVHQAISFEKLSQKTGVPIETIKYLNPAFLLNTVPASADGHAVTLPVRHIAAWRGHPTSTSYAGTALAELSAPAEAPQEATHAARTPVACPVQFQKVASPNRVPAVPAANAAANVAVGPLSRFASLGSCVISCIDGFAYYVVQPGECIRDIIKRCPAVKLSEVAALNGPQVTTQLEPGDFIKIGRIE
jgi:hypothetical protein